MVLFFVVERQRQLRTYGRSQKHVWCLRTLLNGTLADRGRGFKSGGVTEGANG